MAAPPSLLGATYDTSARLSPAVATTPVGAPGGEDDAHWDEPLVKPGVLDMVNEKVPTAVPAYVFKRDCAQEHDGCLNVATRMQAPPQAGAHLARARARARLGEHLLLSGVGDKSAKAPREAAASPASKCKHRSSERTSINPVNKHQGEA